MKQTTRLLLLIACLPRLERPPWWWPLWRGCCRGWLPGVLWLDPLRPIKRTDIDAWYDGFSEDAKRTWHRDRLREELRDLFEDRRAAIRYRRLRRHLLEGGVLEEARLRR